MYKCECCNKEILKTSNWKSHIGTEKHILNVENAKTNNKYIKICSKCHSVFIIKTNYNDHCKICDKNIFELNDGEENNKKLKKEIFKLTRDNLKNKEKNDKFKEEIDKLKEENIQIKSEIKFLNKIEKENLELKDEINKFKEEINKLKEENIQFKGESKYFNFIEKENLKLNEENKLLNEKLQQFMKDSNNKIEETKKDIIKICDKQLDFAKNVSKDSNKITSSAMSLLGFLQKKCPDAPPLLEFNKNNYEYSFTFDEDFVYDILYAFDNDTIGEFIGKIINTMFLKENKEDQSLFATDCVRLNYSIKEYINENKNKWTLDKGANKVKSIIINPLLEYFIKELKMHIQKENNKMMLSGTKKSDDYTDKEIKGIEYNVSDDEESASDDSEEGWKSPKEMTDDEDDYMLKSIKKNITKPLNISKNKILNPYENPDKIKNPNKYHKELTIKERDAIIKQSTKIIQFIKAIEEGIITKEVLKFITKFYQLDKSYFE
jgi:hypothetical protein